MEAVVTAIVGGLLLLIFGWIKLDINRLGDDLGRRIDRLSDRVDDLVDRVAHIEGRLDGQGVPQ